MRLQIDSRLKAKGWVLDPEAPGRNVFLERTFVPHMSSIHKTRLGDKSPDYTFFSDGQPLAILEAKKPSVGVDQALAQGVDYAKRIGVNYVFACNGPTFRTLYVPTGAPLLLNGVEVSEPLSPSRLREFSAAETGELLTISDRVIKSREDLIHIFERLNDTLRAAGIRAGLDRFSEFANLLFLKLLSEREGKEELWKDLLRKSAEDLPEFINTYVIGQLRAEYGSDVLTATKIDGKALKAIIVELNPLRLSGVDEDIKGVAFEHFLRRTTAVQNDLGEYFTPRHVVRFMVRLLNPQFGKTIFDPFCGTGGFLTEAFRHLSHQTSISRASSDQLHNRSLFGREITSNARIAKMNMILFGDGHSGVVQGDSLRPLDEEYDYVLSNIPFSLRVSPDVVTAVDPRASDADEACLLRCFNSLRTGGALAVVVPDGLVVNRSHRALWQHLCRTSRIRIIASLPRGSFAPYTEAAARVLFLTDKRQARTDWYYDVTLEGGAGSIGFEEFQFFYEDSETPIDTLPSGVDVVTVENRDSAKGFYIERPWKVDRTVETVPLSRVAEIRNGQSITKAEAEAGEFPVIAGGRGTVPYTHNAANADGGCFTISKSGAYSGYVWWHETPFWASDCMIVRSISERKFLSFYLYLCMSAKQDEIYLRQQGTGQPHVYRQHVENFPIPVLPLEEQRKYVQAAHLALAERLMAERKAEHAVTFSVGELNSLYGGE